MMTKIIEKRLTLSIIERNSLCIAVKVMETTVEQSHIYRVEKRASVTNKEFVVHNWKVKEDPKRGCVDDHIQAIHTKMSALSDVPNEHKGCQRSFIHRVIEE